MMKQKLMVTVVIAGLLSGCAMDNMSTTQKALLAGTAAAAIGGIAYGVHQKHEADKEKHKHDQPDNDDRYTHHSRHRHNNCYDSYSRWECEP